MAAILHVFLIRLWIYLEQSGDSKPSDPDIRQLTTSSSTPAEPAILNGRIYRNIR